MPSPGRRRAASGGFANLGRRVIAASVDHRVGAGGVGRLELPWVDVGDEDWIFAHRASETERHEAQATSADDQQRAAFVEGQDLLERGVAGHPRTRIEARLGLGDGGRVQQIAGVGHGHVLAVTAVPVGADESRLGAQVLGAIQAVLAFAAADPRV